MLRVRYAPTELSDGCKARPDKYKSFIAISCLPVACAPELLYRLNLYQEDQKECADICISCTDLIKSLILFNL